MSYNNSYNGMVGQIELHQLQLPCFTTFGSAAVSVVGIQTEAPQSGDLTAQNIQLSACNSDLKDKAMGVEDQRKGLTFAKKANPKRNLDQPSFASYA